MQLVTGERIVEGQDGATLGGGADPMAFSHQHHRAVRSGKRTVAVGEPV